MDLEYSKWYQYRLQWSCQAHKWY